MKILWKVVLGLLICSGTLYAAPVSAPSAAVVGGASQVGVVSATHGAVKLSSGSAVGKVVEDGQPVYLGDEVSTGPDSTLQILLLDETVFTIGPNSAMVIDKFIYDPSNDTGKVNARVTKGVFRFITGKIARKNPEDMRVDMKSGTIGIRGTIVAGECSEDKSLVVLLGPGSQNNTAHHAGEIVVSNPETPNNPGVQISRTGFGTVVEGSAPPTQPFEVPAEDLARLSSALGPQPEAAQQGEDEGGQGGGESATEEAGQDTAEGGESAETFGSLEEVGGDLSEDSANASQEASEESQEIEDGIARARDLTTVTEGQFHYSQINVSLSPAGQYSIAFDIDFGARKVGGGNSHLNGATSTVDGNDAFNFAIPSRDFPTSGDATFNYHLTGDTGGSITSDANAYLDVNLNNASGDVAATASHSVDLYDISTFGASGSGTASRSSGLS